MNPTHSKEHLAKMLKACLTARTFKREESEADYLINPKKCPACGVDLPFDKRNQECCSRKCSGHYQGRMSKTDINCLGCGALFKRHQPSVKCCSYACHHLFQYREYIERWKAGKETGVSGDGVSSRIRRYLIETRGNCCEICGWNEIHPVTGNVPITVEHIDGNYRNNQEENLKLLCPNHHSLTLTYGALNKGKGRKLRHKS